MELTNNSGRKIHAGEPVYVDDSGGVKVCFADYQSQTIQRMGSQMGIPQEVLTAKISNDAIAITATTERLNRNIERATKSMNLFGKVMQRAISKTMRATVDNAFLPALRNCINEKQYSKTMACYKMALEGFKERADER